MSFKQKKILGHTLPSAPTFHGPDLSVRVLALEHRLICGTSLRVGVSDLLMVDWGTLLWPKTRGDRCGGQGGDVC